MAGLKIIRLFALFNYCEYMLMKLFKNLNLGLLRTLLVFVVLGISFVSNAQFASYKYVTDSFGEIKNTGDLHFELRNSNFLRDNEYFGEIVEGYTLMGFWIQPSLSYQITETSNLKVGTHFLKFSGRDAFYKIEPYLVFEQQLSENLKLFLGSLDNDKGHMLPEPVFDPERYYHQKVDNGIQFLYNGTSVKSDHWLSWDKFIYYGDSAQEQLTAGSSNVFSIINNENIALSVPLFALFTHRGGQINRPKKPIETLINCGSGVDFRVNTNALLIKSINISPNAYYYKKNTSVQSQPFNDGWAFHPSVQLVNNFSYLNFAWWHSNHFIGPRGEAIYQSVSTVEPELPTDVNLQSTYPKRNLFIAKVGYFKTFANCVQLNAGFEGYYDNKQKLFDYNFSVHLNYTGQWLIHNFGKK